jgi:hypothetical protein
MSLQDENRPVYKEPTPEEISDSIKKKVPDINVIKASGIIKNTDSYKTSKKLTDSFFENVSKNFPLDENEVTISNNPPLFKIVGLDPDGNVKVKTETSVDIKRGNTIITLDREKLKEVFKNCNTNNLNELKKIINLKDKTNGDDVMSSDDIDDLVRELEDEAIPYTPLPQPTMPKLEIPKTVNMNAYEIRLRVLENAIEWVKSKGIEKNVEDDYVINLANKFYRFVENKRF